MDEIFWRHQVLDYAPPPRGGRKILARMIAWAVIVASVVLLVRANWMDSSNRASAPAAPAARAQMQIELTARYAIGVQALLSQSGKPDASSQIFIGQLDAAAKSQADKLGVVVVVAELLGKDEALKRLKAMSAPPTSAPAIAYRTIETAITTSVHRRIQPAPPDPVTVLQSIYAAGPQDLSPDRRAELVDRLGWLGRLALTFGKPDTDPERAALISSAKRTAGIIGGSLVGIVAALALGLVLLIFLLIRLGNKKLKLNYQPVPGGDVFLEAFAVYIGGMTAAMLLAPLAPASLQKSIAAHLALMIVPTLLAIAWPVVRGIAPSAWRQGLGWHAGRGVFREIGCGLAGYLAGLPVMAVGFGIMLMLIKLSGAMPSHPVQNMMEGGSTLKLLAFLLAGVYAPLTEETMFRGAFFHALRGRRGWIISAAITSFIFAAIHPQGWAAVPALMSVAIVFAGIREWRGTILSSAAAHAMHNTALLTVFMVMMK